MSLLEADRFQQVIKGIPGMLILGPAITNIIDLGRPDSMPVADPREPFSFSLTLVGSRGISRGGARSDPLSFWKMLKMRIAGYLLTFPSPTAHRLQPMSL